MSEKSSIPSFFNLVYPNKDSVSEPILPLPMLPIHYKERTLERDKHLPSLIDLEAYNNSYLIGQSATTQVNERNVGQLGL